MKYNKFFERLSQCLQIDTSNSYMVENDLDYSGGVSTPQYKFNGDDEKIDFSQPLDVFADADPMYSEKTAYTTDEEEINSKENSENNLPLFISE